MKYNYLKYYRVVRYFICKKYELSGVELDALLFLYSEGRFGRKDFDSFAQVLPWDKKRFDKLLKAGWIQYFRKPRGPYRAVYELSMKSKLMINKLYQYLEGTLKITEDPTHNRMFLKKKNQTSYTDKVMRNVIMKMNKEMGKDYIANFKGRRPQQPPE